MGLQCEIAKCLKWGCTNPRSLPGLCLESGLTDVFPSLREIRDTFHEFCGFSGTIHRLMSIYNVPMGHAERCRF